MRSSPDRPNNPDRNQAPGRGWAIRGLPSFAPVALPLPNLVSMEQANMRRISDLVSSDPGLAQDVIRLANSPLVGARYEIAGILHALAMLGLERMKGLVTTIALRNFLVP